MIWRTALHLAWLWFGLSVASAQLSDEQKTEILKLHNQYRSTVMPTAANMKRMLWNDKLSKVAELYADACRWEHNPYIYGILGENLFLTLGPLFVKQPLALWSDEFKNYNFSTNQCAEGKLCGHYTQMVWANTSFIGCAAHFCPNVSNFGVQNATILVCNYYPPGNIIGQSPYTFGPPCYSCPNETLSCTDKYCDQGSDLKPVIPDDVTTLYTSAYNALNAANMMSNSSLSGFTTPSMTLLLLAILTAFYIRMT